MLVHRMGFVKMTELNFTYQFAVCSFGSNVESGGNKGGEGDTGWK